MAEGATSFGASSANVAVAVDGTENAQFISQVVPTSMGPGQTQLMRITLQNTGQTTWTTAGGFQLGSQSPPDNTTWGPSRIALPHSVTPGQSVVFSFPVTAPSTTGTYDFQWRMVQGASWFGDPSSNTSINVQTQTSTVNYIHVDHLNTPRLVANAARQTIWWWDQQEPFGNNPADTNPSGLGVFDLPLRLPRQYYDVETGLHYNYYRDYDPSIGGYKESDLIGLRGGLNTYAYVSGSPLTKFDRKGLQAEVAGPGDEGGESPPNALSPVQKAEIEQREKQFCYAICMQRRYESFTKPVVGVCVASVTAIAVGAVVLRGGPAIPQVVGVGAVITTTAYFGAQSRNDKVCRAECGLD